MYKLRRLTFHLFDHFPSSLKISLVPTFIYEYLNLELRGGGLHIAVAGITSENVNRQQARGMKEWIGFGEASGELEMINPIK